MEKKKKNMFQTTNQMIMEYTLRFHQICLGNPNK